MTKIFEKIWLFILLYSLWTIYDSYDVYKSEILALNSQIPILRGKISESRKKEKQVRQYLKDIEEAKKQIDIVAEEVEKITRQLPDTIDDAENLGSIKSLADELNIKKVYLSPLNEENRGFYVAKRYELTASGTFLQFLILIEKLGSRVQLLNIKNVKFTKTLDKQRGRFQLISAKIIVEAYRYDTNYKENRGIREIEKNFKEKDKKNRKNRKNRKKS